MTDYTGRTHGKIMSTLLENQEKKVDLGEALGISPSPLELGCTGAPVSKIVCHTQKTWACLV